MGRALDEMLDSDPMHAYSEPSPLHSLGLLSIGLQPTCLFICCFSFGMPLRYNPDLCQYSQADIYSSYPVKHPSLPYRATQICSF